MKVSLGSRAVAVAAVIGALSGPVYGYEKKSCEFVDDDGACNRMESVADIQLVKKGTPYAELRQRMLAKGYQARPTTSDPTRCEPELADNCRRYPETVSCKSVGGADCNFVLYTNGVAFVVQTISRGGPVQRVKSVHHLTIQDQKDLENSFK